MAALTGCVDAPGAGRADSAAAPGMALAGRGADAGRAPSATTAASGAAASAASTGQGTAAVVSASRPRAGERPALLVGATAIWLDSTTMADVGAALGGDQITDDQDVHERVLRACFSAGDGEQRVTIRLIASQDIEESATRQEAMDRIPVWSATVVRGDSSFDSPVSPVRCVPLPVQPSQVRWWNGMRLGMTQAEVEGLLGPPRGEYSDGAWEFGFSERDFPVRRVDRATGQTREVRMSLMYIIDVRYQEGAATHIATRYQTYSP